jgi:hypothetical protein
VVFKVVSAKGDTSSDEGSWEGYDEIKVTDKVNIYDRTQLKMTVKDGFGASAVEVSERGEAIGKIQ